MNLEKIKKRLGDIVTEHQRMWQTFPLGLDVHIENCHWCWVASVCHDLIAEVERREQLREAMAKQNMQQEKEIADLEAKMCSMKEALELILPLAKGYAAAHPVGSNDRYIEVAKEALIFALTCPHKEEAELYKALYEEEKEVYALSVAKENELQTALAVGEAGGRLLQAVQEKTQAEVVALQAALDEAKKNQMPPLPLTPEEVNPIKARHIQRQQVLTENGEGAKWLRTYAVVEDIDLLFSFVNRLEYHQCQDHKLLADKDQQIFALQAALDEANGKVMEAEFKLQCAEIATTLSDNAEPLQPLAGDPRHFWSRERWTEEERKAKEK